MMHSTRCEDGKGSPAPQLEGAVSPGAADASAALSGDSPSGDRTAGPLRGRARGTSLGASAVPPSPGKGSGHLLGWVVSGLPSTPAVHGGDKTLGADMLPSASPRAGRLGLHRGASLRWPRPPNSLQTDAWSLVSCMSWDLCPGDPWPELFPAPTSSPPGLINSPGRPRGGPECSPCEWLPEWRAAPPLPWGRVLF